MKIRTRIISYVFFSCFVVITSLSAYIYSEMKEVIVNTVDARIAEINNRLKHEIVKDRKPVSEVLSAGVYSDIYILVKGDRTHGHSALAGRYLPPAVKDEKFEAVLFPSVSSGAEREGFRFVRSEISLDDEKLHIISGVALKEIQHEIDEMFLSVLAASVVALLAVGILGVLISNTILRPIKEIISSSGNINSRNMSSRIKTPSTRDEIYDLTVTLNSLFDRLEKSFNLQKDFIANISHEIKTPLTVMNLSTDEELQKALEEDKDAKYPLKIYNNLNRINKLVKDIINLSYIETNQLASVEEADLLELTDETLDNFSEMIEEKKIRVMKVTEGSALVRGEPRLLYSAVMNLIHNAVKYNVDKGYINISISEHDGRTEFLIENSCADNSAVDTEKLFDRFYRGEKSRAREYGGAGLGLAIVREIIHKHDGDIYVLKPYTRSISFKFII